MRLLLFTDGSAGARAATTWLEGCTPVERSALHVVAMAHAPRLPALSSSALRSLRSAIVERSQATGADARRRLEGRWPDLSVAALEGDPHELLLRAAEQWRPDLVVIGRSAGGDVSPSLGSLARLAALHLECSVLLVGRGEPVREVVLGMDGSVGAREAIRLLLLFAFARPPRVLALGIVDRSWREGLPLEELPPSLLPALHEAEQQELTDAHQHLADRIVPLADRAVVESEVALGRPAEVLLDTARRRDADLIAIGHQGIEPVRRLPLGSVAAQVLGAAPCSLLIGRT